MDRTPAGPRYRYELGDNQQSSYVEFGGTVTCPVLRIQRNLAVDDFVVDQLTRMDRRGYRYLLGTDESSPVRRIDQRIVVIRRGILIDALVVRQLNEQVGD